jgi:hypothetical protein
VVDPVLVNTIPPFTAKLEIVGSLGIQSIIVVVYFTILITRLRKWLKDLQFLLIRLDSHHFPNGAVSRLYVSWKRTSVYL